MARHPESLTTQDHDFLNERHLGTLTTLSRSGRPHSVAIAFTYDAGMVHILTSAASQKVKNIERSLYASVCQVDGRRWLSLEGPATIRSDSAAIASAVTAFARRYRPPSNNPSRVIITIEVETVLGRADVPSL